MKCSAPPVGPRKLLVAQATGIGSTSFERRARESGNTPDSSSPMVRSSSRGIWPGFDLDQTWPVECVALQYRNPRGASEECHGPVAGRGWNRPSRREDVTAHGASFDLVPPVV